MVVTALLVLIGGRIGGIGHDGDPVGVPDDRVVLSDGWYGGVDVNLPPPAPPGPDIPAEDAGELPVESPPEPVAPARNLTDTEALICAYDWSCSTALGVGQQESGSDYIAYANHLNCVGTFQICPMHHWRFYKKGWDPFAFDVAQNVQVAYELWLEQGWTPWGW